jgi:hypothetical protein
MMTVYPAITHLHKEGELNAREFETHPYNLLPFSFHLKILPLQTL